jgi:hypothetical protein
MLSDIRIGDMSANRLALLAELRAKKAEDPSFTVVDVGGSAGGWTHDIVDAIVDANPSPAPQHYRVNLNRYADWDCVRDAVARDGPFSFAICSHTLEDIANPMLVLEMLPQIAHRGYIAVPSKYREFSHIEGKHLGYIHHRWIFDADRTTLLGYPKLGFLETMPELARIGSTAPAVSELSVRWSGGIPYRIVNDDYLGPSADAVRGYYRALL